ncbi:reverse transcriptase domain-containing protein [Tanacetum coccineum]
MSTWCHMFNFTLTGNARKKYIKDPIELYNIKQRDGESTKDFVRRYKLESIDVKGAPECMRIFGFVHGITNPELIKRLHDKIPKTVDEIMRVTTSFLRGEVAASNHERKKSFPPWKQQEEILFPPLDEDEGTEGPMIIEIEIGGHCIHRIEDWRRRALRFGLDEFHGCKVTISVQQNYWKTRSHKITSSSVNGSRNAEAPNRRRSNYPKKQQVGFARKCVGLQTKRDPPVEEERVKVAVNLEYPEQTIMIGSTLTEEARNKLCNLLHRNLDIFAWKPADMTGVPRHFAEHRLNVREGCSSVRQKKRGQTADKNQAIQEEVGKLVEAGIMKEVHYHDWLFNPVMVKKHDDNAFWSENAGATYQRLVDKAFDKQIGRNLEVYVDDLVIKSRRKDEIVRDIEETFKTLRELNMKLNPKKCTFRVEEGMFLGYKVNTKGLKVCPDKKIDFHWTTEAEEAFKQMKQLIAELPMLTAPMEKEELIVYLAAAKETVSAVLMTEREAKQMPIYFVSKALTGPKVNYTSMEKSTDPAGVIKTKLGEYAIHYRPRVSVKGQILADFIVERPEEESSNTLIEVEEELPEPWILFTDGSSCTDGSGAGLILTNPEGMEFTYALRFRFDATNNKAEYEALIVGLRIAEQMGVKNLQANVDSRLVATQVNGTYIAKEADMIRYLEKVRTLTSSFKAKQVLVEELKEKFISEVEILAVVEEEGDTWMTPIFEYLQDETLPADVKKARAANYVLKEIHEGSCSMHAALEINLDLFEERREQAAIHEAKSKARMEKYYNFKVKNTSFKLGDLVYHNNDASRTEGTGKLGPKWEGPYEVAKALGKGAYKLRDRDRK